MLLSRVLRDTPFLRFSAAKHNTRAHRPGHFCATANSKIHTNEEQKGLYGDWTAHIIAPLAVRRKPPHTYLLHKSYARNGQEISASRKLPNRRAPQAHAEEVALQ